MNTGTKKATEKPIVSERALWYAIRVRSRHEKVAADQLQKQGIETFLPLLTHTRRWSDRQKQVESPLFAGYAFVRFEPVSVERLRILKTHGVVGFVGPHWEQTPVPEAQIRSIQTLLGNGILPTDHTYLKVGQRVRVRGGALDGVEGVLSSQGGDRSLVITVEPIARSLSIRLEGYDVEVID